MKRAFLLLTGVALLPSCTVGPTYHPRSATDLGVPDGWSVTAPPSRDDLTRWWRTFDDPVLTQLVEQAATTNLDIAQSIARLRQAREAAR